MSTQPFSPQGDTVAITSAASATAAVQVKSYQDATTPGLGLGPCQYEIQVNGAVAMYFTWLGAAQVRAGGAVAAPVIPVNGTPGNGYPVLPGMAKVITAPPGAYFRTISTDVTSTAFITPGDGL